MGIFEFYTRFRVNRRRRYFEAEGGRIFQFREPKFCLHRKTREEGIEERVADLSIMVEHEVALFPKKRRHLELLDMNGVPSYWITKRDYRVDLEEARFLRIVRRKFSPYDDIGVLEYLGYSRIDRRTIREIVDEGIEKVDSELDDELIAFGELRKLYDQGKLGYTSDELFKKFEEKEEIIEPLRVLS